MIAARGDLPGVGEVITVELPIEGGDFVDDDPVRRYLEIEVLEIDRHVPSELRVRLIERAATGPVEIVPADDASDDDDANRASIEGDAR